MNIIRFMLVFLSMVACGTIFYVFIDSLGAQRPLTFSMRSLGGPQAAEEMPIDFGGIIARPFSTWPKGLPLPCFQAESDWKSLSANLGPTQNGFMYVKPYKTGSSTTSGINLRITRNIASRRNITSEVCKTRFDHGPWKNPANTLFGARDKSKNDSFLWTVIREPTKRATSMFFHFDVSREKVEPSDKNFIEFLRREDHMQHYYLRTLYTGGKYEPNKETDPVDVANHILEDYNFIGVTERMDESAVVLMMLLDLPMSDILYVSAKTKGGYDDGGGRGERICTYIWPSFVSEGMQEYFASTEWQEQVKFDLALFKAVNRSLDLTIDRLGRSQFDKELAHFREAQAVMEQECLPNLVTACTSGGKYVNPNKTDCLWKDSGCGTSCLDEVATELHMW